MWYVVQVCAGKEQRAKELIEHFVDDALFKEVFVPRYEISKRLRGEWRVVTDTLIPGYLFVITNEPNKLAGALRDVPAFTRMLGNDDVFTPLSDQEIQMIDAFAPDKHRVVRMSEGVIECSKMQNSYSSC